MMSLWDALRMNMMISYQELVRTFLKFSIFIISSFSLL
ncbi:ydjO [Escherichia coli]|nr:ydjO [Escherichia coli]